MPSNAAFPKKYLVASSIISAAVYVVFLGGVYPFYGMISWVIGLPLMAAPWFYFLRRRPATSQNADVQTPRRAGASGPRAAAPAPIAPPAPTAQSAPPAKPSDDPADFRLGQAVHCQQCNRAMTLAMPRKDSTGKIMVASVDDMMSFAFRCRDCNYVTCARCALLAYEMHNPRQGIPTCPSCGKVAVPFFAEWLTIKKQEHAAQREAVPQPPTQPAPPPASGSSEEASASPAVIQHLLATPYSCAMYARVSDAEGKTRTCFLLHEEEARVRALPAQVPIEARAALMEIRGIGLVVVLLRVHADLYETYWNYHVPEGRACFDDMAKQDDLLIRFYSNSVQPSRTLALPTTLKDTFAEIERRLAVTSPWSMEEFNSAKAALDVDFPTVQALWDAMVEPHPAPGRA